MIDDSEKAEWGAHGARRRSILDDPNLTRLHENTMVLWTREVGDAFNRAIILPDRFGKFNANPFAYREGRRAEKANDSATEGNVNDGAGGDVRSHCPGRERRGPRDERNIRSRYCHRCHVRSSDRIGRSGLRPRTHWTLSLAVQASATQLSSSWHHAHWETEWASKRYVSYSRPAYCHSCCSLASRCRWRSWSLVQAESWLGHGHRTRRQALLHYTIRTVICPDQPRQRSSWQLRTRRKAKWLCGHRS